MVGLHHGLNGLEFEQTLEDGEGQGSLVCCSPWGHKESDMTERLNNKLKARETCMKTKDGYIVRMAMKIKHLLNLLQTVGLFGLEYSTRSSKEVK